MSQASITSYIYPESAELAAENSCWCGAGSPLVVPAPEQVKQVKQVEEGRERQRGRASASVPTQASSVFVPFRGFEL